MNPSLENIPEYHDKQPVTILKLQEVLSDAVKVRIESIPTRIPGSPRLAILFSGGLDCMILAALSHIHVPQTEPIDLLNVAFENPRSIQGAIRETKARERSKSKAIISSSLQSDPYAVPDRKTAIQGIQELQELYPEREWRLVCINVPFISAQKSRETVVSLLHPSWSVMDYSIALAFYHASHGSGCIHGRVSEGLYTSTAKVLFSGLGADEQFGGYSRHRGAWERSGWPALLSEMQLDLDRIGSRNLGRDDRIIADSGKEVRFPYLDETFVGFASALRIWEKVDLRMQDGGGDKVLLREVLDGIGLKRGAREKKRAIQFGAKSAKMQGQEDGKDRLDSVF